MNKNRTRNNSWFYLSMGCIVINLLSNFLPIVRWEYDNRSSGKNIVPLLKNRLYILLLRIGSFELELSSGITKIMLIITILMMGVAIIGLIKFKRNRQYWDRKSMRVALVGLIGGLIPPVIGIIILQLFNYEYMRFSTYYYNFVKGHISLGIAPVISIISLLIAIRAIIRRRNQFEEETCKKAEEKGLIQKAGDL